MMHILPRYIHKIKPNLKHIYLRFDEDGNLIITSPKVSTQHIEQLLLKKSSWIHKSQQKLKYKKGTKVNFMNNPKFYFLGKQYTIDVIKHNKQHTTHSFNENIFTIHYHTYNETIFQKHINDFYKSETLKYIPNIVQMWAKKMKLSYQKISFRKTKRQWGSCSQTNALSFNTMMMKLPPSVIEYIVVHELAHILHKHHQKDFWKLVKYHLPNYKDSIKILNQYST